MVKVHPAWWRDRLLWAALCLAVLVIGLPHSEPVFAQLFPQLERPVYRQEPFTQLLWQQEFDDAATAQAVKQIVGPANEQNLDRLTAVLKRQGVQ